MSIRASHVPALLLAGVLTVSPYGAIPRAPDASAQDVAPAFAITHGPYLQLPSASSVTLVWHTNRPAVSRVEYGLTEDLGANAFCSEHGLIPNDRSSHAVRLTGLVPGRTYRYRVVSREFIGYEKQHVVKYGATVRSQVFSFTTLDPEARSYSVAVVSDIHEDAQRLDSMLGLVDWTRTPLVVFNGDMVNDFMNVDQPFAGFIDASVGRFARDIPFIYVRGNHDVRGRHARRLADYFPTQDGRAYYSFDHGPVHFVVLDSGEDKVDAHQYYNGLVAFEPYRVEQARWLAKDLASAAARRARYRVFLSHIPPYESADLAERQEGFAIQEARKSWEPLANSGRVDLWLSGHTHRYAHVEPGRRQNRYHLVIGAPDTLTRVNVSSREMALTVTRATGEQVDAFVIARR